MSEDSVKSLKFELNEHLRLNAKLLKQVHDLEAEIDRLKAEVEKQNELLEEMPFAENTVLRHDRDTWKAKFKTVDHEFTLFKIKAEKMAEALKRIAGFFHTCQAIPIAKAALEETKFLDSQSEKEMGK